MPIPRRGGTAFSLARVPLRVSAPNNMIDYHIHLEQGPFTLDWVKRFWDQAQSRGIGEIGIAEHCHRFREFWPAFQHLSEGPDAHDYMVRWLERDFQCSLDEYIHVLQEARMAGIPVKIGIETDYPPQSEETIGKLLQAYPFDFVLGSVHVIGKWGFDYGPSCGWENRDPDVVYRAYYQHLLAAAQSGLFDIVAHFDVVKVFGCRPTEPMDAEVDKVLQSLARQGTCIEVSTGGLRKPIGEIYPSPCILKKAAAYQVPITIASDAHYPDDVGSNWEQAVFTARSCGYREYRVFSKRQSYAEKLPK